MIRLADAIGRVMMAAVTLPRQTKLNSQIEQYIRTEFKKDDQAYVFMCYQLGRKIDVKNITV